MLNDSSSTSPASSYDSTASTSQLQSEFDPFQFSSSSESNLHHQKIQWAMCLMWNVCMILIRLIQKLPNPLYLTCQLRPPTLSRPHPLSVLRILLFNSPGIILYYKLVFDKTVKPRFMHSTAKTQSLQYVQIYSVKCRIDFSSQQPKQL